MSSCSRAWAAGPGWWADDHRPGLHGQGAAYTRTVGYHPLLATRADTGEVLHVRQRAGRANTARGTARFVDELAARVRRGGRRRWY